MGFDTASFFSHFLDILVAATDVSNVRESEADVLGCALR
jgi:hypothetical protein